jgi:putative peptidoglycan lipid II flippase
MFSMNNILARAFFALSDIKTPMKISVFCLGLNLLVAIVLVRHLKEAGLGLANTLTAGIQVCLLLYALRRKLKSLEMAELRQMILALAANALLAGLVAGFLGWLWERHLGHGSLPLKMGAVFLPGAVGCLVYGAMALLFKIPAAQEMAGLFLKRFRRDHSHN